MRSGIVAIGVCVLIAVICTISLVVERLRRISDYQIDLDVSEDDQLLILVTCVGNDRERRIIAAHRLREGESAKSLKMMDLLAMKR